MAKRTKLKVGNVLLAINVVVIAAIVGIYTGRLLKYYKLEHKPEGEENSSLLVDALRKKRSYVDLTKGLVCDDEDNTCLYKGEVKDNYISYSGFMYRILGIDTKNNIVAVSEDVVTLMYAGLENGYSKSYVNKWLNSSDVEHSGKYESSLFNSDLLDYTLSCDDKIENPENITCEDINSDNKISLLSLNDYKNAGGKSSFINNNDSYSLVSLDKDGNVYYITPEGDISVNKNMNAVFGVRPVITINHETELLSGKGTKEKPYIIEKHDMKELGDAYIGSYVKVDNYTFKVVERGEEITKLASTEVLQGEEGPLVTTFGKSTNKYNKDKKTLGYYLNNDYLNTFESKDLLLDKEWYVGNLELGALDYTNIYKETTKAKVGLLGLSDFYVNELKDTFTLTRGIESTDVISVVTKNGTVFNDSISSEHNVRSAIQMSSKLKIVSGDGSSKNPFVLGGNNEED